MSRPLFEVLFWETAVANTIVVVFWVAVFVFSIKIFNCLTGKIANWLDS